jgi:PAS domain S-box-containing protein
MPEKPTYEESVQRARKLDQVEIEGENSEKALRESEEKFRLLHENAPLPYQSLNENGRIIEVNQAWLSTLGYEREEVIGKSFGDFLHPDWKAHFKENFPRFKAVGEVLGVEFEMVRKDGSFLSVSFNGKIGTDHEGHFQQTHCIFQDITKRKQAEEKIRKLNETLEQRVADRTTQLENRAQQLQQLALELSHAEDRERRHIASILHDDFQQQLAYIKIELSMLQEDVDKKVGQKLDYLKQLIADSIEQSRNLSYDLNPPVLHRYGLLAALVALGQDMKNKHGLEVKVQTQPDAEPDSLTLASILYRSTRELLLNVVKHAGVGSAVLDVHSENGMIHIRVEDFGNGFDYDTVMSNQTTDAGFGLYNIEDRTTFLGGSIKIKSTPGKGCCVKLTVPIDVLRRTASSAPPAGGAVERELMEIEPGESPQTFDERSQIRILLADDHQLMRKALADLLEGRKGFSIVGQAIDGGQVVQLAAKLKPDVILMDVTMPEFDGLEATSQITRHHPDIRIIGLSMHNDAKTRQKMLQAGASAYLVKTDTPDELVETIRQVHYGTK